MDNFFLVISVKRYSSPGVIDGFVATVINDTGDE